MIVVPNHLVEQWGAAFLALYPQARIFVAGREHFAAGNRQKAMARIATGNYDAVIVSHRSFEKLPVSDEMFKRFVEQQIEQLEDGDPRSQGRERRQPPHRQGTGKSQEAPRREAQGARRPREQGRRLTFEQLGIDQIFVDEADLYKNLGSTSRR